MPFARPTLLREEGTKNASIFVPEDGHPCLSVYAVGMRARHALGRRVLINRMECDCRSDDRSPKGCPVLLKRVADPNIARTHDRGDPMFVRYAESPGREIVREREATNRAAPAGDQVGSP